jgi:hypothetical protein
MQFVTTQQCKNAIGQYIVIQFAVGQYAGKNIRQLGVVVVVSNVCGSNAFVCDLRCILFYKFKLN